MNKKVLKVKQELEKVLFEMEDSDSASIIYSEKDNSPKFTVRAEVDYDRLEEICEALDEVIQRYDDGAYFEPDVPGRADCYLWNFDFEDSIKDGYYDEDDEDDSEERDGMDDFFCVTLNNMSNKDAKFYGKTYGLFIRANRNKGYDLAGSEDQVRAMLEDYIGRYDEIGRIMNEGHYIPDWNRGDFVNPHKRYVDSKKLKDEDVVYYGLFQRGGSIGQNANAEYRKYPEGILLKVYTDREQAKEDAKRYRKSLTPGERSYYGMGYSVKPLNKSDLKNSYVQELISKLGKNLIKDFKDSDPWHELAHYLITFEDGHKETDTLPIYVRDQCSSDKEIIDMLQDYYDDKIVAVKQVGWSRIGDSKKKKVTDEYYQEFVNKILYAIDHFKKGITVRNQKEFDNARAVCESNGVGAEYNPKTGYVKFIYDIKKPDTIYRDSKKRVKDSYEGNLEALAEYLEWEGIIGYNSDIEEIYETNEVFIDDEWETFENPYDALDAYLTWEGILGYTDAIYDILENGVESVYYNAMLTEKEKSEEYTYEDFERDLNHLGIKEHTSTLFKEASRGLNNLKRVQKISGGWWNDVDVEQVYKLYEKVKED